MSSHPRPHMLWAACFDNIATDWTIWWRARQWHWWNTIGSNLDFSLARNECFPYFRRLKYIKVGAENCEENVPLVCRSKYQHQYREWDACNISIKWLESQFRKTWFLRFHKNKLIFSELLLSTMIRRIESQSEVQLNIRILPFCCWTYGTPYRMGSIWYG